MAISFKHLNGNILIGSGTYKFKHISGICELQTAGFYDENDVMIVSWDELVNNYGLDVEMDYSSSHSEDNDYMAHPTSFYSVMYNNRAIFSTATKLVMPDTITKLGKYSLTHSEAISLATIVLPSNITSIPEGLFYSNKQITNIIIPTSVTSIGDYAFFNCTSLVSIKISNSVTSIGQAAFNRCLKLIRINIPNSVISIDGTAFGECESLESIFIPNSVTNMGTFVFAHCYNLTIYCEAESKPEGWDNDWNNSNCPVVWDYEI